MLCVLIERVRTISHRVTQKNRTHKGQKDDGHYPFPSWPHTLPQLATIPSPAGPSPDPSPEGKGSDHRDTPIEWMLAS